MKGALDIRAGYALADRIGIAELRRLRQVEEEIWRLKQPVADLTLDKQIL